MLEASPFHGYRFEDGHFIDPQTGWVVNPAGEVWKTQDGGATWDLASVHPSEYIRSVAFLSEEVGFFGTLYGGQALYRTTDGGQTFEDVTGSIQGPAPAGICGLFAVDEQVVYGVGSYDGDATLIKTVDGGQTWTSRAMDDVMVSIVDVYFWDEARGVVVGGSNGLQDDGRAAVALTEDGGETWTRVFTSSRATEWAWKVSFPTPTTGYVSVEGRSGRALKTTDAGLTWAELTIPTGSDFQGIGFISENVGWVSGRGDTQTTTDGGQTWSPLDLDGQINRFEFFGDTLAYAMGTRIYKLGRLSTATDAPGEPALFGIDAVYPNPAASALTVDYRLATPGPVRVSVFDLLGRHVATLAGGRRPAGSHRAVWDGRLESGSPAAPGVYVVRLQATEQQDVRRVTVLGR